MICEHFFLSSFHTADTRAYDNSASVRIEVLEIRSCILKRSVSRIHRILRQYIGTANLLLIEKIVCAEVFYGSLYIKLIALSGEPLLKREAVLSFQKAVPEIFFGISYRADYAHTGDYNSAHFYISFRGYPSYIDKPPLISITCPVT